MAAVAVHLAQHVEHEGLHVKVQRLVVQEQFGQQTQVLAVDLSTCHTNCHSIRQSDTLVCQSVTQ